MSPWDTNRQLRRSLIKTPPLRLPGQSVDERISILQDKFTDLLILPSCLVVLGVLEWWHWWTAIPPSPWVFTIVALISIIYVWKKGAPLVAMVKNLRLGRDGERSVGQMLEPLREKGYRVFHDIPGDGFNIDHAIVGPAGVFTIETKARSKPERSCPKIVYDGNTVRIGNGLPFDEPLNQARAQARWLANLLNDGRTATCTVRPVVVFPEWYVEWIGRKSKDDVWVLNPKALDKFLDHEPHILSPSFVDSAVHALTRHCRQNG